MSADASPSPRAVPDRAAFNRALLRWAAGVDRHVAIRRAATPWEILVAEVMSQQTQIGRIAPAWRRFVERWPTPADFAAADGHEVLGAWAGLGYNRRALALREAARTIVRDHRGRVPGRVDQLEALPGIGPYTARAIAAAAFGIPVAPLDVNVRRVVSRVLGHVAAGPSGGPVQAAADALVARRAARRWVDAVMDLAATVCVRRDPACGACPVRRWCASSGTGGEPPRPVAREPFHLTRRWLRGRLLAALREAPPGAWSRVPGALGAHGPDAIATALAGLARDGLVERHPSRPDLARLPA